LYFQAKKGNARLEEFLEKCCNIHIQESHLEDAIATLRSLVVAEWLGEFTIEYQGFMTRNQLQEQAAISLDGGEFAPDVGDLVISAISNILMIPVIILTSVKNIPVVIQHPTHSETLNVDPVFVAYNQCGCYSAIVPTTQAGEEESTSTSSSAVQMSRGCNCGRKPTKGLPCSFDIKQYTCRCPCYNEKQACLVGVCRCRNCANPFGCRPKPEPKTVGQKRKREPHQSQSIPLQGKRSLTFMQSIGEPVTTGTFSSMEFLVVSSIVLHYLAKKGRNFSLEEAQKLDATRVYLTYCSVFTLAKELGLDFALYERTQDNIQKLSRKLLFKCGVLYKRHL
jgi:hypothetical protein